MTRIPGNTDGVPEVDQEARSEADTSVCYSQSIDAD
jgi:hypothetical protein